MSQRVAPHQRNASKRLLSPEATRALRQVVGDTSVERAMQRLRAGKTTIENGISGGLITCHVADRLERALENHPCGVIDPGASSAASMEQ